MSFRNELRALHHPGLALWCTGAPRATLCCCVARMPSPSTEPLACTVYLECTSGIGDLIFDAAAGVTVALERGCVMPLVRTHWQRKDRHYDWPALFTTSLFRMDAPTVARNMMHANGGPFPRGVYNASEQLNWPIDEHARQDVVVVTFPTGPRLVNGSCGTHYPTRWMLPLVPHASAMHLVSRFRDVLRSIRVLNTSELPSEIAKRAVVHYRRGDRYVNIEPRTGHHPTRVHSGPSSLTNASRLAYHRLDTAVMTWLLRMRLPCHIITDDPIWGELVGARLLLIACGCRVTSCPLDATERRSERRWLQAERRSERRWLQAERRSERSLVAGSLFVARLRHEGIDTSFREHSSPIDDLAAMMHARVIVRAAPVLSHFCELAGAHRRASAHYGALSRTGTRRTGFVTLLRARRGALRRAARRLCASSAQAG